MSKTSFVHQLQTSNKLHFFFLRPILKFASIVYGVITHLRNLGYKYHFLSGKSVHAPVISIGNIIAGGTGKTPMVIWLIQNFPQSFPQTILLSRGYGGDEQQIFAQALPQVPHFTGSKRYDSAQKALQQYGEDIVFLLDDGFQHRQLNRDLDIVLIDATCPFGYKHMLPRGFLREYLSNLKRADVFIITRSDMVTTQQLQKIRQQLRHVAGEKLQVLSQHVPAYFTELTKKHTQNKHTFTGKKAVLFCGIGNPNSFCYLVENLGVEVIELKAFDDHYHYTTEDITTICRSAQQHHADIIITTAKDAVKISEVSGEIPIWVLQIEIDITEGKQELISVIENTIRKKS
ncbi:tetraacyldisaccharide 4'-kinase [Candidatus Uabimicrobium amorphum]|uniref:Tetraacyldisaccharide 4'-kinase n=1 Tax=Uabimicrobium amorphum TaxID=2596890 RepID=A0A5S9IMB7_UABAM|nr:tetraacyldisaccharide 4'-kinase [Candidatus Uabimicrobium amorphum]BBM84076.1 tetraacyldisaccharide 4'-kinase [Candidatus Uabimicrobium amorphum]